MKEKELKVKGAISEHTVKAVLASISPNTERAYRGAIKQLEKWLNGRSLTDESLADYIATCFYEDGKSASTISLIVSAVAWRSPDSTGEITTKTLAGIRREAKGRKQVQGLSYDDVDRLVSSCYAERSVKGVRDALLIRLMSDCLLRVSEAVAVNVEDFQQGTLIIQKSKSDQEGEGASQLVCDATFHLLSHYLDVTKIEQGALFRRLFKDGSTGNRLTARSARQIIKDRSREVGLAGHISGHSLRVGAAESLAAGGATLVEMQIAGRWEDPKMPAHYARTEMAKRGAVARIRNRGGSK